MPVSPTVIAGRILPQGLFHRLKPALDRVEIILAGTDEHALAQRIAAIAFVVRVLGAFIAYISQIFLARLLGGYEYGIFVVVWTWVLILGATVHLGLGSTVVRLIPEYLTTGRDAQLRGLLTGSRWLSLSAATLVAGIGALGVFLLKDLLAGHYVLPLYLALICVPLFALSEVQDGISRAFSWPDLALTPTYIWRPLLILSIAFAGAVSGYELNAVTTCLAAIGATYVTAVTQLFFLNRRLRGAVENGPRRHEPVNWLRISLPILLVDAFHVMLTGIDVIILGKLQSPEQVAIYFAAAKTLALVHFVSYAVRAGSAHHYSKFYHSGDDAGLERFVSASVKWTFWPSLLVSALVIMVGRPLLSLFGEGFEAGYGLLFILVFGVMARAALGPAETLLTMAGRQKIAAVIYAATLMLNVVLCLLMIPRFGIYGAAGSTAIAMICESVLLYLTVRRCLGLHVFVFRLRGAEPVARSPAE